MLEIITSKENILNALRSISKNQGGRTPGVDGKTIKDIKSFSNIKQIETIQWKLTNGNYQPKRVKRLYIQKPNGDSRPLGIPTIEDRIIQQAIKQVLEPIMEAQFSRVNSGFRPRRSAHNSIAQVDKLIQQSKMQWAIQCDIKGFFDNVDHNRLIKSMWGMGVRDKRILSITKRILKTEIVDMDGQITEPQKGTPQGGVISPLLANIYLNNLDKWIESQWTHFETKYTYAQDTRGKPHTRPNQNKKYRALRKSSNMKEMYIVRYADDFIIFTDTEENAKKIKEATTSWLKENLKLECSSEKTKIVNLKEDFIHFLGFKIKISNRKKISKYGKEKFIVDSHVSENALKSIKGKLQEQISYINKSKGDPLIYEKAIDIYNSMVIGIHNYYKVAHSVNNDMGKIGWDIQRRLYHKVLKGYKDFNTKPDEIRKKYQKIAEIYGNSKELKWINGKALVPIRYVQFKNPMSFSEKYKLYDPQQDDNIVNVEDIARMLQYFAIDAPNARDTVEFYESKMSRLIAQKGLCGVTKEPLKYGELQSHHIIPIQKGGKDNYENVIIINQYVHNIIHTCINVEDGIEKVKKSGYSLNAKQSKKLEELIVKVNN